jgi:Predicted membrane protein
LGFGVGTTYNLPDPRTRVGGVGGERDGTGRVRSGRNERVPNLTGRAREPWLKGYPGGGNPGGGVPGGGLPFPRVKGFYGGKPGGLPPGVLPPGVLPVKGTGPRTPVTPVVYGL